LGGEVAQEAVVAGPVREHVDNPGDALAAEVVGGREADFAGEGVVPVGALGEIRGIGLAVGDIRLWVGARVAPGDLAGHDAGAAPPHHEGDRLRAGVGALDDLGDLFAGLDVLPIAGLGAAYDLGLDVLPDLVQVFGGVARLLERLVDAALGG